MSSSVSTWNPLPLCLSLLGALFLVGCSSSFESGSVEPNKTPIGNIQGSVHGGQAPVTGAQIYLFAAGTGGYGTNATSLITSGKSGVTCNTSGTLNGDCYVTTDSNGNFALGGDYTCTEGTQVYMVAVGGNPGLTNTVTTKATFSANSFTITVTSATGINVGMTVTGTGVGGTVTGVSGTTVTLSQQTTSAGTGVSVTFSGVNNTAIVQMAGLGECPAAGNLAAQVPYLVINEVTTVALAYSVGGFATTAYNISSDATGATALANAFANSGNIVNIQWGQAPLVTNGNTNSTNPQSKIYALANILATCVNTTSSSSTGCTNLFKEATTSSGTQATDESNAIFNIVHNQAQNVANIYNLGPTTPVFTPTLTARPTDWTMPVIYKNVISTPSTGGTTITSGPYNLVFDASGDAWIGDRALGVVEIGPQGAVTNFSNRTYGFGMVKGVAVSPQDGSIWVSDYGNNDIYVMDSSGTAITTLTTDLKNDGPILTAFALNPAGGNYMAYEADETNTGIVAMDSGTFAIDHFANGTSYNNVDTPGWIAVDNVGAVWIPSTDTTDIGGLTVTNKSGTTKYTTSQSGVAASYTTAADGLGNVWVATNAGTANLYQVAAGSLQGSFSGGGMNEPFKSVVDGNNVVWLANDGANTVSGLSASTGNWLSSTGFSTDAPGGTGCVVIGVDPSGNVWTGNSDQSVTQLLGLGTPTAAPLYGGSTITTGTGKSAVTTVTNGNLGTKP
jgi:hypothetical protein